MTKAQIPYITDMKSLSLYSSIIIIFLTNICHSQLPQANLYIFEYHITEDGLELQKGKYLTDFNPKGYNNQPHFINDNELLISSNYFDEAQTDIIRLNMKKNKLTRVTATDQGEYSPTVTPNRRELSVIREVLGGDVNQILWRYPLSQDNAGKRALANETTVGYHAWLSGTHLAAFLVGDPHQLYFFDLMEDRRSLIANNPGRGLISTNGILYYVQKSSDANWYIKSYDPENQESKLICETVRGSEDFDILNDGSFIMAKGSKLYSLHPDQVRTWKEVADLSELGISNLNRLKVKRNKIVLVNAE